MIGVWIFAIVVVICMTIIVCVFLSNSDNFRLLDSNTKLREINHRLSIVENYIEKIWKELDKP